MVVSLYDRMGGQLLRWANLRGLSTFELLFCNILQHYESIPVVREEREEGEEEKEAGGYCVRQQRSF
jgi:hypothetical protein